MTFHLPVLSRTLRLTTKLQRALAGRSSPSSSRSWTVIPCATTADLLVASRHPATVSVVVEFPGEPMTTLPDFIRGIMQALPAQTIVLYVDLAAHPASIVLDLGRAGLDHIITTGVDDDENALKEFFISLSGRAGMGALFSKVARLPCARRRTIVETAIDSSATSTSADVLARRLNTSGRNLRRRSAQLELPSPGNLLRLARVTRAAHSLLGNHRSLSSIAKTLQFGGRSAVARSIMRAFGESPGEISKNHTSESINELFMEKIRPDK